MTAADHIQATGRRKTSTARVILKPGKGQITVNGKPLDQYFTPLRQEVVKSPLQVVQVMGKYDITANVRGGGSTGQSEAIRHGIARALNRLDAEMRKPLKAAGFIRRDPRMVERKKYGRKKARRRFQFSKR